MAQINGLGRITAIGPGKTRIMAKLGGISRFFELTVKEMEVAKREKIISSVILEQLYERKENMLVLGDGYEIEIQGNRIINEKTCTKRYC